MQNGTKQFCSAVSCGQVPLEAPAAPAAPAEPAVDGLEVPQFGSLPGQVGPQPEVLSHRLSTALKARTTNAWGFTGRTLARIGCGARQPPVIWRSVGAFVATLVGKNA